jgi:hypothetical protein
MAHPLNSGSLSRCIINKLHFTIQMLKSLAIAALTFATADAQQEIEILEGTPRVMQTATQPAYAYCEDWTAASQVTEANGGVGRSSRNWVRRDGRTAAIAFKQATPGAAVNVYMKAKNLTQPSTGVTASYTLDIMTGEPDTDVTVSGNPQQPKATYDRRCNIVDNSDDGVADTLDVLANDVITFTADTRGEYDGSLQTNTAAYENATLTITKRFRIHPLDANGGQNVSEHYGGYLWARL